MSRLIFVLILQFFYFQISFTKEEIYNCKWDNKNNTPCIEIINDISNSSEFAKRGVNKVVISKKQIDEMGAIDLIDVLAQVPDINLTQSGPKGQQTSMFMRGTGSNHTLVMINGVAINDQSTTQGLHDFGVDFIQTIHQIEIFPGSSASHFGTNAIGGAINIILAGDFKDSIKFASDNNSNYEFTGNKTFIYDNSSLNLKIGGIKNETTSALGSPDDEKDGVKNYSANINFENYFKNFRVFNNTYLRQTVAEYDNSSSKQSGYEGDNLMGTTQFGLENLSKSSKQKYLVYYNMYDREYDERGTIDSYESEAIGIKYDLSKTLNNKMSLGVGTEYKYDWGYFDNQGSYQASTKGNSDNISLYSNLGYNFLDNYNLALFVRNDKHKQTGNNSTFKVNIEKFINGSNLGISYMNGLRNPTLYEMYGTDNFGYSGNRDLDAEKSNTLEIYSNLDLNEDLKLSTRAFRSNIKNNIEYINNKYRNDNDDIALNQSGLNSTLSYKNKDFNFNLFGSFLSSKKENGASQLRRPQKNFGANFTKDIENSFVGNFKVNLKYKYYGKHFDTHSSNFSTIEMDSREIIDLKLSKKIENTDFYFKITNLLDDHYQKPHGYSQEGRVIKLGFKN